MHTARFYNLIAPLYLLAQPLCAPGTRHLARHINALPPGRLLEIGCGNGSLLSVIHGHRITGIDSSEGMLAQAGKRMYSQPPQLQVMNGEQLSFADDSFDYLVINHVLAVTAHPEHMLEEACRVLRPGGLLLLHNHFSPQQGLLRGIDYILQPLAKLLRFRSWFPLEHVNTALKLPLIGHYCTAPFGYFRLLIYQA